ncbi:hypothetical protein BFW01_g9052 [Lasiodiplodia theobromae]|uniref:Carbohydrate-binding module family 18 protein n=1 Tax=Lasiodiplodia theobromae TaxID=45133 RepID=UPI0015C39520|nr:Carbohydrate-binding module family 18 protein [Lasiodiplodia theobromae]KAF4533864.1 Carbohydrate-binding module family 18 protein [Lasiodiplodia theobromae]KAF9638155.1 hypothetical protein BFW01_g9052 [Lasiodiplodia theobromae]
MPSYISLLLLLLLAAASGLCQNCGPKYNNQICAANTCCSQYGWCDTGADYCDPATCLSAFSGPGSSCAIQFTNPQHLSRPKQKKSNNNLTTTKPTTTTKTSSTTRTTTATATNTNNTFAASIPVIDVCGHAQGGVSCPGAGPGGYFYRCCSAAGHCGPKNDIQDAAMYCGDGCQAGFGKCGVNGVSKPVTTPSGSTGTAGEGETCGPIVNKRCADGLCCSGSNFCGTGEDFCGAANWCQPSWGSCAGKRTV